MDEHPIQELMTTAMENLKEMIEINTIIGDPVESPDGTVIIPVSKVGFGYVTGGSEFQHDTSSAQSSDSPLPFGGGSGGGVSVSPVAFLIIHKQEVKMVHLSEKAHLSETIIEQAPKAIETIESMLQDLKQQTKTNAKSKRKMFTNRSTDSES